VRNPDTSLRPGMFARVSLITRDDKNALVVPEQAIVPQGDEQFVFRVVDGKAVRNKVEVGVRRDAKVEIVKGLAPADTVVTAGQLKLRDGMRVTIAPAASSNAGGNPAGGIGAPGPEAAAGSDAIAPASGAPAVRRKADNAPPSAPRS
jgi:membrane fusion protein, multidrug efflux system